jgi:hypothetical protein
METEKNELRRDQVYAIDQLVKLLDDDDLWKVIDFAAKIIAVKHISVEAKNLDRKA